jgi:pimeloyl-ACP methyl ester carboxylesterase
MDFDYVVVPALILLIGVVVIWLSIRRILSLSTSSYKPWRKVVERVVLSVVVLVAGAVAASASFNAIALLWFRAHNPPPGVTYAVDGHKMHMYRMGSGSPTIVLDAGLGNDALIWGGVQPELSKTTRVCAYDRAGFGWSDARPAPRDSDHIAVELHELLSQANVTGPIVLMGHSIAGIYIRDYASRYPADLAGLIFVDGSTPLQQDNPAFKAAPKGPPQWAGMLLMKSAFRAGVPRLFGLCSRPFNGFDAHASKLQAEDQCHAQVGAMIAEMDNIERSGYETRNTGPYGALPILIFSHDPTKSQPKQNPPKWMVGVENAWNQMQDDLLKKEVPIFIQQIRGTAPQPTNYGSTITE